MPRPRRHSGRHEDDYDDRDEWHHRHDRHGGRRRSHDQDTRAAERRRERVSSRDPETPRSHRHSGRPRPHRHSASYSHQPPTPSSPYDARRPLNADGREPSRHDLSRKRSLIRPERRRANRHDPDYYYRKHAARMAIQPSRTGRDPVLEDDQDPDAANSEEDLSDVFTSDGRPQHSRHEDMTTEKSFKSMRDPDPPIVISPWSTYYHLVTFWCPNAVLRCFGKLHKTQQRAWREKVGLITIILLICTFVGYLTFGFTATVCPTGGPTRLQVNKVDTGYLIIHGRAYDLTEFHHPAVRGIPANYNVLWDLGQPNGGKDASFMFQNVNGRCKGLITASQDSDIPTNANGDLAWYFPCTLYKQDGSSEPNLTIPYYLGYACHLSPEARNSYYDRKAASDVFYTWDDIKNSSRNLAVWGSDVIDLNLLRWFNTSQVSYPPKFDEIRENANVRGKDLTLAYTSSGDKQMLECFSEIIKVGSIDTETIGCIASRVVLYVSLAFILALVLSKFFLAILFRWILCHRYSVGKRDSRRRAQEIEDWSNDIYQPPPRDDAMTSAYSVRSKRSSILPTKSRFSSPYALDFAKAPSPMTMTTQSSAAKLSLGSASESVHGKSRDSNASFLTSEKSRHSVTEDSLGPSGLVHEAVVPQPPHGYQPFGYPLAHALCLVTCYSEGYDSIRTTLDSIATTEYPNSHKTLLVICDGLVTGKGEVETTPEIVVGMMKDLTILPDEVLPYSYVAVASGYKRHNMAKVYAGFYDYGYDSRVPRKAQQRVPMLVVVKCGTPYEAAQPKPGNRGKRDSQIILMSFLQKVMFDERMTELEYEIFNGIWKVTGISPEFYEVVLTVDADTKVFPDCMNYMVAAMVKDPEVMGLCGETKIENKHDSWVTRIQVFEYFISHHLAKSFESVFGGVTCLPGCFSMYRIKTPKGSQNYWVPILANPDIVEHYSENVVDTLHKKNLLLLGEDRYLSTLMLKTFPKRKQVFVPQAVCKTTVPNTFDVLLSQRRRWINSTVHNLMELVLVRDLCGTFCFSMQFVVFIELIGTVVLPAAFAFTIYLSKSRRFFTNSVIRTIIDAAKGLPVQSIPLILLALILGLPAVLIVLTAQRWSYVLWMLIYIVSLPLWNTVLPAYAFWKFDDFSWGETRKTAGEKHAGFEYEGEFDSSQIVMKRWADYEQERRLKEAEEQQHSRRSGRDARDLDGRWAGVHAPPSAWSRRHARLRGSYGEA